MPMYFQTVVRTPCWVVGVLSTTGSGCFIEVSGVDCMSCCDMVSVFLFWGEGALCEDEFWGGAGMIRGFKIVGLTNHGECDIGKPNFLVDLFSIFVGGIDVWKSDSLDDGDQSDESDIEVYHTLAKNWSMTRPFWSSSVCEVTFSMADFDSTRFSAPSMSPTLQRGIFASAMACVVTALVLSNFLISFQTAKFFLIPSWSFGRGHRLARHVGCKHLNQITLEF